MPSWEWPKAPAGTGWPAVARDRAAGDPGTGGTAAGGMDAGGPDDRAATSLDAGILAIRLADLAWAGLRQVHRV